MVIQEKRAVAYEPEKIKNAVTALEGKIFKVDQRLFFFNKMVLKENPVCHRRSKVNRRLPNLAEVYTLFLHWLFSVTTFGNCQ